MGRPPKFPDQFRDDAVGLVLSGRSVVDVAGSLGVNAGTLGNWVKRSRERSAREADPAGLLESERDELRRLRKEIIDLRADNHILKRAAAYFARETMR
jgi:transposase